MLFGGIRVESSSTAYHLTAEEDHHRVGADDRALVEGGALPPYTNQQHRRKLASSRFQPYIWWKKTLLRVVGILNWLEFIKAEYSECEAP